MPLPRNRYLELWQEANHVFGQQMCDPMTLTLPGQAHNIEVGLDFHKVLDAMLVYKLEVPTRQCVDALANLERLGARITIISFTGHEGYARAASQTAHFRDCVRAAGLQMGGGNISYQLPSRAGRQNSDRHSIGDLRVRRRRFRDHQ